MAIPDDPTGTVARTLPRSLKVTEPAGVPEVLVTFAVKVTSSPKALELTDAVIVMLVESGLTT